MQPVLTTKILIGKDLQKDCETTAAS